MREQRQKAGAKVAQNAFGALDALGDLPAGPEILAPVTTLKRGQKSSGRGRVDIVRQTAHRGGKGVTVAKNFNLESAVGKWVGSGSEVMWRRTRWLRWGHLAHCRLLRTEPGKVPLVLEFVEDVLMLPSGSAPLGGTSRSLLSISLRSIPRRHADGKVARSVMSRPLGESGW